MQWTRRRRLPTRRRPGEARRHAVRARRRVRIHDGRLHRAERHLHEAGSRIRVYTVFFVFKFANEKRIPGTSYPVPG